MPDMLMCGGLVFLVVLALSAILRTFKDGVLKEGIYVAGFALLLYSMLYMDFSIEAKYATDDIKKLLNAIE